MFRATKINGYLQIMEQQGIDAKQLLAGTQIDAQLVSRPDYLISLDQYHSVVANMMRLTGDNGIAFSLGNVFNVKELGIFGYAMLSASSLKMAIQLWIEYSKLLIGAPINIEFYQGISPGYELMISSISKKGMLHQFETEETMVQGLKLVQDITGVKPLVGKASFSYPKPRHSRLYDEYFKCPIEFDAPHTIFRILAPELDASIQTRNEELFMVCEKHCREVMRSTPETGILRSRIRSMFLETPGALPDIKTASAALGMSVSTLFRQLETHGQSYQSIKNEFRFDLAREYLRSGHMVVKQIAYLLGYSTPSGFSRAFKDWSGQTVGEFLASENKRKQ
jgi:AraC-like DNA-binding protein